MSKLKRNVVLCLLSVPCLTVAWSQYSQKAIAASPVNLALLVSKNACASNVAQNFFQVTNNSSTSIPLSNLTFKYWVDDTSGPPMDVAISYGGCVTTANGSCVHPVSGVTATAVSFSPACGSDSTHQANWEITVSTTDGFSLAPGETWSNVQTAINLANFGPFTPGTSDWYSRCGIGQPYAADPNFAVYDQGSLVEGTPPACRAVNTSSFDVTPNPFQGQPPDPTLSVSPGLVGVMHQNCPFFFNKSGVLDHAVNLPGGGCDGSGVTLGGDPQIIYDPTSSRWFITMMFATNLHSDSVAFFVSTDASAKTFNPVPFVPIVAPTTIDQPHMTVTQDKVVVGSYVNGTPTLWVIDKSGLLAGAPVAGPPFTVPNAQPGAHVWGVKYGTTVPSQGHMVVFENSNFVDWFEVTGTNAQGNVQFQQHSVTFQTPLATPPGSFPEPGGAQIQNHGNVGSPAMWQGDHLWWSSTETCGSVSCVRMFNISTNSSAEAEVEFSMPNTFLWGAAPGIDSNGDMFALMSAMPANGFPGLAVAGQLAGGFSRGPVTLVDGLSGHAGRWGDYFGAAQDPANGTVWTIGEFAAQNGNFGLKVINVQSWN